MIKTVILDFDDTLCLTEEACFKLENETLRKMGRKPMNRTIHKKTWGQPLYDAIQLRSPGVDANEFWHVMPAIHMEFIESGKIDIITDQNLQVLDNLAADGKELMILTSRTRLESNHLLDPKHHLASRIAHFYHKDNTKFHKPDPRVFEMIERDHKLKPEQCVYVGDSPSDAAAAKGAGLHFIASLESSLRSRDDFSEYAVDAFIDRFSYLRNAILSLDKK